MNKYSLKYVLSALWLMLTVAACAPIPNGIRYTGGTKFDDSSLFFLLLIAIPVTAYMISNVIKEDGFTGELFFFIGGAFFLNYLIGMYVGVGDPQEIQDKSYIIAYTLLSAGGGTIIGCIVGAIRRPRRKDSEF
ncbi:MAG: hypothetical protein NTX82_07480 [Candidatus Parcubacteria bacterium]|nr:hypothetical protein [Candidatus Parcubacteria bacterium]